MRRTSRRTPIAPHKGDKPNVLRNQKTQVKIEVSAGRALAIDRPHKAKNEASASVVNRKGKQAVRETKSRHTVKRDG